MGTSVGRRLIQTAIGRDRTAVNPELTRNQAIGNATLSTDLCLAVPDHIQIRFVGNDTPVHQANDAVAALSKARIVRYDQERGAVTLIDVAQQIED